MIARIIARPTIETGTAILIFLDFDIPPGDALGWLVGVEVVVEIDDADWVVVVMEVEVVDIEVELDEMDVGCTLADSVGADAKVAATGADGVLVCP